MRCLLMLLAALPLTTLSPTAPAQQPPGQSLFARWCAECHAPGHGHPGTQQLGWTRGAKLAVLEQRRDLTAPYIQFIVRNGLGAMPAYRPSEISDAQLVELASYLAPARKRQR
jgi:mono/diheme cytochrome c family protein